jgi:lysozyme family protein
MLKEILNDLLEREGGYVNNPNDSGGETNWGITVSEARANAYFGPMATMPRQIAYDIYHRKYWVASGLQNLSTVDIKIAERLLDIAVNMGLYRAGEFCQRLLNALNRNERDYKDLRVDAKIGPATCAALRAFLHARPGKDTVSNATEVFLKGLRAMQGNFYIELAERRPKDEEFLFGWLRNRA